MSIELNKLCELIVDCPHSTAVDEGTGYPLIRTPNIGAGFFDLEGVHRVSKAVYDKRNQRAIPQSGDLILAREAPAGNVAIIPEGAEFCLGQRTVLIRPNASKVYSPFLNYYLNAPEQRHKLLRNANGATVSHVNMPIIRNLPIELPPMKDQRRIAEILATYDSLIENNRKQIKLLEEAAQRLFKEWFIDLRFPGHETAEINPETGLPDGWRYELLTDNASIQYGYAFDASFFNSNGEGIPIVRIRNIQNGFSDDFTTEEFSNKYRVFNGDLLVGMDGEFCINTWIGGDAALVQRSCRIKPIKPLNEGYLKNALKPQLIALQNGIVGATVSHLGKKHIDSIKIVVPSSTLIERFRVIEKKTLFLRMTNLRAAEARDRLLPGLISNEIEV